MLRVAVWMDEGEYVLENAVTMFHGNICAFDCCMHMCITAFVDENANVFILRRSSRIEMLKFFIVLL